MVKIPRISIQNELETLFVFGYELTQHSDESGQHEDATVANDVKDCLGQDDQGQAVPNLPTKSHV